jgi:CD36 family
MTFHPDIQHDEKILAMVPDFVRVASFLYLDSDWDKYNGLEMTKWQLDPALMLNKTENKDNEKYDTEISGTANLRKMLQAPTIASKGHFYQIAPAVHDQLTIMKNR